MSVFSKTLPPLTKPIKIRSTTGYNINAAYQKAMEKIFDFLVSASKNGKTSKDLYNKLFKISTLSIEDQAYLNSQLASQKPVKILKTHHGIILVEGERKTKVQWTAKRGEILLNGKPQPWKKIDNIRDIFERNESSKSKIYHTFLVQKSYALGFAVLPLVSIIINIAQKTALGAIFGAVVSNAAPLVKRQIEDLEIYLPIAFGSIGAFVGVSNEILNLAPPAVKARIQAYRNIAIVVGLSAAIFFFYFDNSFKDGFELVCEKDGVYKIQKLEDKNVTGTIYKYDGQYLIIGAPGTAKNFPKQIHFEESDTIDGETGFIGKTLFIHDPNKQSADNNDLVEIFYRLFDLQTDVPTNSDKAGKELVEIFLKEHKERYETCKKNPNITFPLSKFQSDIGEHIRVYPGQAQ